MLLIFLALIEVKSIDDNGVIALRGFHTKLYVCVTEKGKVRAQVRTKLSCKNYELLKTAKKVLSIIILSVQYYLNTNCKIT